MQSSKLNELWTLLEKYNRRIITEHPQTLNCKICQQLIIDAHQSKCGCTFCKRCIDGRMRGNGYPCPGGGKYCKDTVIKTMYDVTQDHKSNVEVTELQSKCPNDNCSFLEEFNRLPYHLKTCPKLPVTCPFKRVGCKIINITNDVIDEHLRSHCHQHSTMMLDYLQNITEKTASLEIELAESKKQNSSTKNNFDSVSNVVSQQKKLISGLEKEFGMANTKIHMFSEVVVKLNSQLENVTSEMKDLISVFIGFKKDTEERFSKIKDEEKEKEKGIIRLVEEQRRETNSLKQELTNILKLKQEIDKSLKEFNVNKQLVSDNLMKLNYGEYLWAIDHFSEKIRTAQAGKNEEIVSSIFYSHKNGYKLRLKCFPNGAVTMKGKYFGISFYILKGEFDDILKWPFTDIISLSIVDQESKEVYHNVEYSYRNTTDADKHVFNQQKSDNVGFGTMNFGKIDSLLNDRSVLKNDTLYIRCTICPSDY